MSEKLPKGWVKTTLGEITKPSRDRALPIEVPSLRYIGLEHIESQTMRLVGYSNAHEVRSSSVRFHDGDVLYGKMRPYLNKVWVAEFDGICSAEFLVFPKNDAVNSQFLAFRLNGEDFVAFANGQVSGERPRVDFETLSRFPIHLPPVAEQERIVTKLNVVLTKVRRAETATHRAQERLKRYRAAVLHAATTGKLTSEWRKTHKPNETGAQLLQRLLKDRRVRWEETELKRLREAGMPIKYEKWKSRYAEPTDPGTINLPELLHGWTWANLRQLGFIIGGLTKNPRRIGLRLKLPYLSVANVYANELRLEEVATIGVERKELDKLLLEKGDLLIVEGNGSKDQIGRVAIWDGSIPECVHQNHIIKVRLVEKSLGAWILYWLISPSGRHYVEKVASSTTGLYTLSVSKVGDLPIPLPSPAEQTEVILEIKQRLSAADRLVVTLSRQINQARVTSQSVLREAFAGHLVPQDKNDEPASVLLGRISAARNAEAKKPKGKRMSKSQSKLPRRLLIDVLREHKKPITPEQLFREAGFHPAQADLFYRELASLQKLLREKKPSALESKDWPHRTHVLLELKES